jgi:iron complex transport system ATP-binding protein
MLYQIHQLSFAYRKTRVLDAVDLAIGDSEFVSVLGPNGAGKSTLLELMAGLRPGFEGQLLFAGRPIEDWRPGELARKIAFVPQETHVVFPFTAAEMMLMGRQARRSGFLFDSDSDVAVVRNAMDLTGTLDLAGRTFNELSGGERQRVVLASALVQEPQVLLLDEPTVYLDLRHQIDFYEILANLNREGMTILAATHDVNLAARYSGRIIVVDRGRIARDGPPARVVTSELFEEIFQVRAEILTRPEGGTYVIPSL